MEPKRTRAQRHGPAYEVGEDYDENSDSSYNETSRLKVTKKAKKTRQPSMHRTRQRHHEDDSSTVVNSVSGHSVSMHVITTVEPMRIALLEWYDSVHDVRRMPWRKKFDPSLDVEGRAQRAYEVWVSEIMLQQTQVVTVIPYYNKWMEKFPTIQDLAASDIETVNSLWKGLGYYSRAARLLSGAQKTVKELHGRLPDNAKDMEAQIPGVGRYSAGAICSIAYNHCVPVLDGNVHRLLSRFTALHAPPKSKQTLDILWTGAESLIEQSKRPGDINQALIELGSTVCTVRVPVCSGCPLRLWCKAYERTQPNVSHSGAIEVDIEELCLVCEPIPAEDNGSVTIYPMKAERKKAREELDSVNVIEWRSKNKQERWFLLVRRPEGGLLAGLHEFPTASNLSTVKASASNISQIPYTLLKELLIHPPHPSRSEGQRLSNPTNFEPSYHIPKITHVKPAGDVVHVFSHIKKTYRVQWVLLESEGDEPPRLRPTGSLDQVNSSSGNRVTKPKGKRRRLEEGSEVSEVEVDATVKTLSAQWVPLAQVEDANIGTGVLKVWKLAKKFWTITQ